MKTVRKGDIERKIDDRKLEKYLAFGWALVEEPVRVTVKPKKVEVPKEELTPPVALPDTVSEEQANETSKGE